MHRTPRIPTSSIGHDFITFGYEALAVSHAEERRATEVSQALIASTLRSTRPTPWLRRALGTSMIALGTVISGKAARVQKQEAPGALAVTR